MSLLAPQWSSTSPQPWSASFSALDGPVIPPLDPYDYSTSQANGHSDFSALAGPPPPRRFTPAQAQHQSSVPVPVPGPPAFGGVPPRNNRSLDRTALVQILDYLSGTLLRRFPPRQQIRLVIHGGAVMLLNEELAELARATAAIDPVHAKQRETTRDIDYIARSFSSEWAARYGVYDANARLKQCVIETAMQFGLGADWMNSDADVALPMATDPATGSAYDPIYAASIQSTDSLTVYTSPNNMLKLVSVTPYWTVALKMVRYNAADRADICILLRSGTRARQMHWTPARLEVWLLGTAWAMGYAGYDAARVTDMRRRMAEVCAEVNRWDPEAVTDDGRGGVVPIRGPGYPLQGQGDARAVYPPPSLPQPVYSSPSPDIYSGMGGGAPFIPPSTAPPSPPKKPKKTKKKRAEDAKAVAPWPSPWTHPPAASTPTPPRQSPYTGYPYTPYTYAAAAPKPAAPPPPLLPPKQYQYQHQYQPEQREVEGYYPQQQKLSQWYAPKQDPQPEYEEEEWDPARVERWAADVRRTAAAAHRSKSKKSKPSSRKDKDGKQEGRGKMTRWLPFRKTKHPSTYYDAEYDDRRTESWYDVRGSDYDRNTDVDSDLSSDSGADTDSSSEDGEDRTERERQKWAGMGMGMPPAGAGAPQSSVGSIADFMSGALNNPATVPAEMAAGGHGGGGRESDARGGRGQEQAQRMLPSWGADGAAVPPPPLLPPQTQAQMRSPMPAMQIHRQRSMPLMHARSPVQMQMRTHTPMQMQMQMSMPMLGHGHGQSQGWMHPPLPQAQAQAQGWSTRPHGPPTPHPRAGMGMSQAAAGMSSLGLYT